jgi:predicted Zn-dependent protease
MIELIAEALKKRDNLAGWAVRHIRTHEAQMYAVPQGIESQRLVDNEKYLIDVLRNTSASDGSPAIGSGDASLLPGEDIDGAIDQATLMAGLVANPVYGLPDPAPVPNVPLRDPALEEDPTGVMRDVMGAMRAAAAKQPGVRLTAAECFGEVRETHLVNSRGLHVEQWATQIDLEFVLHCQKNGRESEIFDEMTRRRVSDLNLEAALESRARYALDSLEADSAVSWNGPVVLRNEALAVFMAGDTLSGGVINALSSAASKYAKLSSWEVGKPVFRGEVKGDPLTVWANRAMPFGTASNCFDAEGLPARRLELIHENELVRFIASQRYADYLKIPATGAFGNMELPPGRTPAATLLADPHVEVIQFSWFNPDEITGDFATEIRLGYLVENGIRKPFRGGQLVGNYMDALADVRWSSETGFFGGYLGPQTARFAQLKIAGQD